MHPCTAQLARQAPTKTHIRPLLTEGHSDCMILLLFNLSRESGVINWSFHQPAQETMDKLLIKQNDACYLSSLHWLILGFLYAFLYNGLY